MKNLNYKGYTYTIITRPWLNGSRRYEAIKFVTGFRNLWERISFNEYKKIATKC